MSNYWSQNITLNRTLSVNFHCDVKIANKFSKEKRKLLIGAEEGFFFCMKRLCRFVHANCKIALILLKFIYVYITKHHSFDRFYNYHKIDCIFLLF